MRPSEAVKLIEEEFIQASKAFPAFNSAHEGYAVIQEELDELWAEVKRNHRVRNSKKLRKEAMQTAAMALRFLVDCCP